VAPMPSKQKRRTVARVKKAIQRKLASSPFLYNIGKNIYVLLRKIYFFPRHVYYFLTACFVQPVKFKLNPLPLKYGAWYEDDIDFSEFKTDIKSIAYYLPQFHQIPENDRWWGEGFTEWTNTRKAKPLFKGHYQPREPHSDIGYYDLSDIRVLKKQAAMARAHGIHGFCFYHYWFSGKRLLEKPVDLLLEHPEIEIPFCICWANENWTRRWDGGDTTILIEQKYDDEDEVAFIKSLEPYLRDPRYIRIEGKPLITIYHICEIPDPKSWMSVWRDYCRKSGIGEISIYAVYHSAVNHSKKVEDFGIDGFVEFPPHHCASPFIYNKTYLYDYDTQLRRYVSHERHPEKCIKSVMLGWDNTARKGDEALIFNNFNAMKYFMWLKKAITFTRKNFESNNRFIFINAWNEWAEGTYLEPDKKYGYNSLNITSRALFDLPYNYKAEDHHDDSVDIKAEVNCNHHLVETKA